MGGTVGKQLGTEKAANQLQQDAAKTVDSTGVLSGSGTIIKDMQTGVDSWIQSGRDATSPWGESLFGTGDMSKIKFQNPFEGLGGGKDTPQEEAQSSSANYTTGKRTSGKGGKGSGKGGSIGKDKKKPTGKKSQLYVKQK